MNGLRAFNFDREHRAVEIKHIDGVAFLHSHHIAHLHIKPQNIIACGNQLFIIGFDISVRVDSPDALINRWCRTRGGWPMGPGVCLVLCELSCGLVV